MLSNDWKEALKDEPISIVKADSLTGLLQFRVGELEKLITLRLSKKQGRNEFHYKISHAIGTPSQIGPYRSSIPYKTDEISALTFAVSGITQYYEQAVKEGYQPEENWLVEY